VPTLAVIVTRPELNAFTAPLDDTLATVGALDFHVTLGPEITPPVAFVAVATRLIDSPTIVAVLGAPDTMTAATSGSPDTPVASPPLPPHAQARSSTTSFK
jgi:hypothetical protein